VIFVGRPFIENPAKLKIKTFVVLSIIMNGKKEIRLKPFVIDAENQ